jgi:WD repeat-containing protein 35
MKHSLTLSNTFFFILLKAKYVDIRPIHLTMNTTNVIIASKEHIVLWQFNTSKSNVHNMKNRKDKKFHVDDTPSGVAEVLSDLDKHGYKMPINTGPTQVCFFFC